MIGNGEGKLEMRSMRGSFAVLVLGVAMVFHCGASVAKDKHKTEHILGGALIGGAIVAAVSPRKTVTNTVYVPVPAPPPAPGPDGFMPTPGVYCYAVQRACYTVGGGYNPQWTWQVYAR